jgi:hypothetical protein
MATVRADFHLSPNDVALALARWGAWQSDPLPAKLTRKRAGEIVRDAMLDYGHHGITVAHEDVYATARGKTRELDRWVRAQMINLFGKDIAADVATL